MVMTPECDYNAEILSVTSKDWADDFLSGYKRNNNQSNSNNTFGLRSPANQNQPTGYGNGNFNDSLKRSIDHVGNGNETTSSHISLQAPPSQASPRFDLFSAPSQDFYDALNFAASLESSPRLFGEHFSFSPRHDQQQNIISGGPILGQNGQNFGATSTSLDILTKVSSLKYDEVNVISTGNSNESLSMSSIPTIASKNTDKSTIQSRKPPAVTITPLSNAYLLPSPTAFNQSTNNQLGPSGLFSSSTPKDSSFFRSLSCDNENLILSLSEIQTVPTFDFTEPISTSQSAHDSISASVAHTSVTSAQTTQLHPPSISDTVREKRQPRPSKADSYSSNSDMNEMSEAEKASFRGKYKCGRCGQPKVNHNCEYVLEVDLVSSATQVTFEAPKPTESFITVSRRKSIQEPNPNLKSTGASKTSVPVSRLPNSFLGFNSEDVLCLPSSSSGNVAPRQGLFSTWMTPSHASSSRTSIVASGSPIHYDMMLQILQNSNIPIPSNIDELIGKATTLSREQQQFELQQHREQLDSMNDEVAKKRTKYSSSPRNNNTSAAEKFSEEEEFIINILATSSTDHYEG